MSETWNRATLAQPFGERCAGVRRRVGLGEQRQRVHGCAAVTKPFQGREGGGDDVVRRSACGSHAPAGERRDVQFVVGAEHERRSNDLAVT